MKLAVTSLALSGLLAACTTLGPMPATTGVSAVPVGRPGFEVQAGVVPAFYLSQSAQDRANRGAATEASALFEPDRALHLPGLIAGFQVFGAADDSATEPYLGYRRRVGDFSLAGVAFGTSQRASQSLASYHATRIGGELAADTAVLQPSPWFAIHLQAALSVTRIAASGSYCVDANGIAVDCDLSAMASNHVIDGKVDGVFAAATGTLAFDFGRSSTGSFHVLRAALLGSTGQMPLLINGVQRSTDVYSSLGLQLTLGFGS